VHHHDFLKCCKQLDKEADDINGTIPFEHFDPFFYRIVLGR
jgi:hypothetical protein